MSKKTICLSGFICLCMANPLFSKETGTAAAPQQTPGLSSTVSVNELDLTQNVLDEAIYPQIHLFKLKCAFHQTGEVLTLSNGANPEETSESYITIGTLCKTGVIELDLLSQSRNQHEAAGILALYKNKDNQMKLIQRDQQSVSFEIIKGGNTVLDIVLLKEGVAAPNTLRISLTGTTLNFSIIKEGGQCTVLRSIDTGIFFNLRDKDVRESFRVCAGAKLRGGESISLTRFEQYQVSNKASGPISFQNTKLGKSPFGKPIIVTVLLAVIASICAAAYLIISNIAKARRRRFSRNEPANRDF